MGDRYYRYVGPQQQPRPKSKAAATASASGAAGSAGVVAKAPEPVAKEPQQPSHPPPSWQPSLRGADHPVQPASTAKASGPKVTSSVVSVPKAAKSASEGVAASGRDVAPVPVEVVQLSPQLKLGRKPLNRQLVLTLHLDVFICHHHQLAHHLTFHLLV